MCTLILDSLKENVETSALAVEQEHWCISSIAMRERDEIEPVVSHFSFLLDELLMMYVRGK